MPRAWCLSRRAAPGRVVTRARVCTRGHLNEEASQEKEAVGMKWCAAPWAAAGAGKAAGSRGSRWHGLLGGAAYESNGVGGESAL